MAIVLTRNFEGSAEPDFSATVKQLARAASATGEYDFIYIVPTRRRVRELQRELVTDVTFGKLPIYTLELFAHEIFTLMSTGRRVISTSMQGMIISLVLSGRDFKFFRYASFRPGARKGVAPIGTIKKIVDQIGYLEENGITPDDYGAMASVAEESERLKLEEFHRIYADYQDRLGETLADSSGLLSLVNAGLSEVPGTLDSIFPRKSTVFVEGFYNFKKPELEFLRHVSSNKRFPFLIKLDCDESNGNLFRTMISTSRDLAARGFKPQTPGRKKAAVRDAGPTEFLASCLFAAEAPAGKLDLKSKITVAGVRDNLREVEFVAEKIKEIIRNDPWQKLDRICVASYLPQNYSRIFREVLRKYRVPANITDRYTLESNNVVNAILSFVDIKVADYERAVLMRALTNSILKVSEEFGPSRAGSVIYNAARLCRFERGLKTFREAIAFRLDFLRRLVESESDESAEQTAKEMETLRSAANILDSVEAKLSGFNTDLSPEEFRSRIVALVARLGIHENIVRVNVPGMSTELVERDARALTAFFEVLGEVVEMETERGSGRLPVAIWMENLRAALSLTRYNIRQKYGYGVYVTSLEEIRGLEFDYLFIVGLNEGELPAKYDPEIFLPLRSQEENRETEPYLQRHLFYQAVSSFRKKLYLVYPLQRDEVRLVRSSFIDAVTDVVECETTDETGVQVRSIYNVHQLIESESVFPGARAGISADPFVSGLLPSNLERCRTAETARYRDDRESEFAGKLTDAELTAGLDEKLDKRVFSAAQLESLSRCGFQFFARRILQIAEVPDIETSLSAVERGAVLHKILYRFYAELSKMRRLGNAKDELDLLLSVGRDVLDGLGIGSDGSFGRDLFEIERETILGTEDVPGTLRLFLAKVQSKLSEYGFSPENFEVGFGMKSGDGKVVTDPVEIGGVALQGKIDRIDSNTNGLTIFDYKTSAANATHRDVIRDKISPQLIIYMDALNKMPGTAAGRVSGAAFISINRQRLLDADDGAKLIEFIIRDENGELKFNKNYEITKKTPGAAGYPTDIAGLLKETEDFVKGKVAEARSGRFNLTVFPREKVCKFCPYLEACRIALTGESIESEGSA